MQTSSVAGTVVLTPEVFERWQDSQVFHAELCECCEIVAIRSGLEVTVSLELTVAVVEAWKHECHQWLTTMLPPGNSALSHLKMAAILLDKMCALTPVAISGEGHSEESSPENIQDGCAWPELPNKFEMREICKFKDGGCHYLAWQIIYHVCEFFEENRTDRLDDFVDRRTDEFELDIVSGLLSKKLSAQAIHLILKALFLRD